MDQAINQSIERTIGGLTKQSINQSIESISGNLELNLSSSDFESFGVEMFLRKKRVQGKVLELKQGRSYGESRGANSSCGFLFDARFCPCGLPWFQLRDLALYSVFCLEGLFGTVSHHGEHLNSCAFATICSGGRIFIYHNMDIPNLSTLASVWRREKTKISPPDQTYVT